MKFLSLLLIICLPLMVFASDEHDHHNEHKNHDHHDEHKNHDHHDEHEHDELAFEDHSAHVHGHANASISYADDVLIVRLTLASKDIFGFEHIPQNEQEMESVISNLRYLENINNVLTTDPACVVQNITVDSENLPEEGHADHHEIEHSDVKTSYELHCTSNVKLSFKLLEKYSSIEKIAVQYVSASEQHTYTVTHDNRTITLHK